MASRTRGRSSGRSKSGSSSRSSSRAPDAVALLKKDHAEVKALFAKFEKRHEKMDTSEKKQMAEQICHMLEVHTKIEEEIFYPACESEIKDAEGLLAEAKVEHQSAKELIAKIQGGGAGSEEWDAQVTVLGEYVNHHVKEEESELFPKCKKAKMDLKALGQELAERKMALMQGGNGKAGVGGWLSSAMS